MSLELTSGQLEFDYNFESMTSMSHYNFESMSPRSGFSSDNNAQVRLHFHNYLVPES